MPLHSLFSASSLLPNVEGWPLLHNALLLVGVLLAAFIVGGIPFGYLIPKYGYGVNILESGSNSTGGTNVLRVCGKVAGIATYALDFLKAFLPVLLCMSLFPAAYWLHVGVGIAIIVGHSKSVFLGFQGGKSAMSSLGAIMALSPPAGLVCLAMAATIIFTTRIVSIGSMITGGLVWVVFLWFHAPLAYVVYAAFLGAFVIYRHKANIRRLLLGTENRF